MAIVQFGVLITGIRGKLAGAVFSANATGPYVRDWYKSSNPRTSSQSTNRGVFSSLPNLWRGLTDAQRDDWDTWAALPAQAKVNSLGDTYYCSGWNWFATINQRLLSASQSTRLTYPTNARPAAPTITGFTFVDNAGTPQIEVTWAGAEFLATESIVITAASNPGAGHTVQYGFFPVMKVTLNPGASPEDFSTQFVAKFGTPVTGARAFVQVYKQCTQGLRSTAWTDFQDYA